MWNWRALNGLQRLRIHMEVMIELDWKHSPENRRWQPSKFPWICDFLFMISIISNQITLLSNRNESKMKLKGLGMRWKGQELTWRYTLTSSRSIAHKTKDDSPTNPLDSLPSHSSWHPLQPKISCSALGTLMILSCQALKWVGKAKNMLESLIRVE